MSAKRVSLFHSAPLVCVFSALASAGDSAAPGPASHDGAGHATHVAPYWGWWLGLFLFLLFLLFCVGVGWYNGPLRRRSYWVRKPDGSVMGVSETSTLPSTGQRKPGRQPTRSASSARRRQSPLQGNDSRFESDWTADISRVPALQV